MNRLFSCLSALCCVSSLTAQPAITVYNENFGVVRDTVSLDLKQGLSDVSYSGVTAQLEPESVILRDPSGEVALSSRRAELSWRSGGSAALAANV